MTKPRYRVRFAGAALTALLVGTTACENTVAPRPLLPERAQKADGGSSGGSLVGLGVPLQDAFPYIAQPYAPHSPGTIHIVNTAGITAGVGFVDPTTGTIFWYGPFGSAISFGPSETRMVCVSSGNAADAGQCWFPFPTCGYIDWCTVYWTGPVSRRIATKRRFCIRGSLQPTCYVDSSSFHLAPGIRSKAVIMGVRG